MTKNFIILIFTMISYEPLAQTLAYVNAGYGSYNMSEMKQLQQQVLSSMGVKGAITSSFPSFYHYEAGMLIRNPNGFMIGAVFGYGSTGGRVYYSDYSGNVGSDQLMSYISTSLSIGYMAVSADRKWHFLFDAKPGVSITRATITAYETVNNSSDFDEIHAKSINVNAQPTFTVLRKFGRVGVSLYAGYFTSIVKGKLTIDGSGGGFLTADGTNPAHADWSGYRVGTGISYFFIN